MEKFTDRVDVDLKISLYEYGIIRNPKTNKCVICTNNPRLDDDYHTKPKVRVEYITFDDVKEKLEEAGDGYFDYIGSTRQELLESIDNEHLAIHIISLERWDGSFELYER